MNMQADNHQPENERLEAPQKLVASLRRRAEKSVFVPTAVDEAILRAAERHLRTPERMQPGWLRLVLPWAATAAAAVLLLVVVPHLRSKPGANSSLAQADLNRDGRVDILDAFALARQLKSGATPSLQFDVNGDGKVDERDVATLAARAVRLENGGHS